MPDLLVRLYDLPVFEAEAKVAAAGIVIRRAIAPEGHVVLDWISRHFHPAWLSEAMKDPHVFEETWIDAMIVGALLLEDTNDLKGAREMWRKVLATSSASEQQIRTARNRLDAISDER